MNLFNLKVTIPLLVLSLAIILSYNSLTIKKDEVLPGLPLEDRISENEHFFQRLSTALQFETISYDDPSSINEEAFTNFRRFLEISFPSVFQACNPLLIANKSLLFKCPSKVPSSSTERKPILLMAHYDVVPVGAEQWIHPPFSGHIDDDEIWGRGALDDKHIFMAILEAVQLAIDSDFEPTRDIYLAFGHDEEIGGFNGAKAISQYFRDNHIKVEFVLDEGMMFVDKLFPGLKIPVGIVGITEKGFLKSMLRLSNHGAHASMPTRSTLIGRMSKAIVALENNPFPCHLQMQMEMLRALSPYMEWPYRIIMGNLWLFKPFLAYSIDRNAMASALCRTTLSATVIRGGLKFNTLPSLVEVDLNVRISPHETVEGTTNYINSIVNVVDKDIEVIVFDSLEPAPISDRSTETYKNFVKVIRSIYPDYPVLPGYLVANTDTRHYWDITDQIYRFTPIVLNREQIGTVHGVNERISKDNYMNMINFYHEIIFKLG